MLRKSVVGMAVAALTVGSVCSYVARGQGRVVVVQERAMTLTPGEQRMVLEHMREAKQNAGKPVEAERITTELADLIFMDRVAQAIADDPGVAQQHAAEMTDAALKNVHEDAFRIAMEPKRMEKKKKEILDDPALLKTVLHQAEIIQMRRDMPPPTPERPAVIERR